MAVLDNLTYNMTALHEVETIFDLVEYANVSTGNILLMLLVVAFFIVMLLSLKNFGFDKAIVTSGFISFVISSMLTYSGFLNMIFPVLFLAITAMTMFYMYAQKD